MPIAILIVVLLMFGFAMLFVGRRAAGDAEGRAGFWPLMCLPMGFALVLLAVIWAAWLLWQYITAGVPFLT